MMAQRKSAVIVLTMIVVLWALLPLTSKSTPYTQWLEMGTGYTPVVDFRQHHAPPKIDGVTYKDIVWRHERYSFLWLAIGGSKSGQYGLYKYTTKRKFRKRGRRLDHRKSFVPLTYNQAREYAQKVNVELSDSSPVSYWALYFGWLVMVPLGYMYIKE